MATGKDGVSMTRDGLPDFLKNIKALAKKDVLVGIPAKSAQRKEAGEPLNNAEIAYIQTFGSTIQVDEHEQTIYRGKKGGKFVKKAKAVTTETHAVGPHEIVIPPRPFLEPGVIKALPETIPRLRAAATLGLKGDFGGANTQLETAGILAVNSVRSYIGDGIDPPLAASTLAKRRSKGRTGTIPLKDTSEMNNALTYVVRK